MLSLPFRKGQVRIMIFCRRRLLFPIALAGAVFGAAVWAQTPEASAVRPRTLISSAIDESKLITLAGSVRSAVTAANDRGRVPNDLSMDHILLQLKRPPEQEAALDELLSQQTDPKSANYHRWLTAAEYGRFGLAQDDLQAVRNWLEFHGFTVNRVYPSGVLIDFSGTAGQVLEAFIRRFTS